MVKMTFPKRVDLYELIGHDSWKDTYLIFNACGPEDLKPFQKSIRTAQNKAAQLEAEYKKHLDIGTEVSIAHAEELKATLDESSMEIVDLIVKFIQSRFIKGKIRDDNKTEIVDADAKMIKAFPMEILTHIQGVLVGNSEALKKN